MGFRSVMEAIDATGPTGKLILHKFAALAEFERGLTRERTLAGLAAARRRGRCGRRPRALPDTEARAAVALLAQPGIPVNDICKRFYVSRSTLYGYAKRLAPTSARPPRHALDIYYGFAFRGNHYPTHRD